MMWELLSHFVDIVMKSQSRNVTFPFSFCGVRIQTQTVMTFLIPFVELGFNLRSEEFSGIHTLALVP